MSNASQTFNGAMNTYFGDNELMMELQKTLTAYGNAEPLVPIEYEPDVLSELYVISPFLTRLESMGRVQPATSAIVAYRNKTEGVATSFILEDEAMPTAKDSKFRFQEAKMKVMVTPVDISDLAQMGTQDVTNLRAMEITDAIKEQAQTKDISLINGNETQNPRMFDGLENIVKSNKHDLKGKALTADHLRNICQNISDKGGNVSAILTSQQVTRHLEKELYANVRYVNPVKQEIVPGIHVNTYDAPNGNPIPIITDKNIPHKPGKSELYVLDESVLYVKDLMKPTEIPLAKTKLTESTVIAQMTTFYCRAEQWQGRITGIA